MNKVAARLFINREQYKWPLILSGLIFFILLNFAIIMPPFQSNDEYDHLERGYLLSKGMIFMQLHNKPALNVPRVEAWQDIGSSRGETGGVINAGLFQYMNIFTELTTNKKSHLSKQQTNEATKIQWSQESVYRTAPGTSVYFPLIYMPHAIGFFIGEHFNLSLDNSYKLIKFTLVTLICCLFFVAFKIYPTNPLVIFLLLLPKSIYQFSSPTIDGIATALAVFAISLFLYLLREDRLLNNVIEGQNKALLGAKSSHDKKLRSNLLLTVLTIIVCILVTSRLHFMPFWLCLYYYVWRTKSVSKAFFVSGGLLFSVGWYLVVMHKKLLTSSTGESTISTMLFYSHHLDMMLDMFRNTLSSEGVRGHFLHRLIGEVGWDSGKSYFITEFYQLTFAFAFFVSLMSFSMKNFKEIYSQMISLILVSFLSILIIFFSMLFTYTPLSHEYIVGIQGRYFLLPLIFFSYAFGGGIPFGQGMRRKMGLLLLFIYAIFSVASLHHELLNRFYE